MPAPAPTNPAKFNFESSKRIYESVRGETDAVMQSLEQSAGNASLSDAISVAKANFLQLKSKADAVLQELDKDAEWDAFIVAFYGETNAGKSTIIETLRILLAEQSKLKQQQNFRETLEKFGIDEKVIAKLEQKRKEIAEYESELRGLSVVFSDERKQQQQQEQALTSDSNRLFSEIQALPFWRRILSFIWKIPLRIKLLEVKEKIGRIALEAQQLSERQAHGEAVVRGKIDSIKKEISSMDAAMKELAQYEDGAIIGDGQSDFTRNSSRYDFEVNGNRLVLLDVPGIEGKEELVREPIMQAVRKAHAVFYVTRKAEPPQKGDEKTGGKGTLEKIKEHLGAQTEVWAIFNKSIKSPEQLRMPQLINEGERHGLAVLEDEMRKQLSGHYAGLLCLSAHATFVASADHLVPGGAKSKDRGKFLAVDAADSIRRKTGFQDLIAKLGSEMVENSRPKIRRSNFNKANEAVLWLKSGVDTLIKECFAPLFDKLESEAHAATLQLDSATDTLKNRLESDATELFERTRNQARKQIYSQIERDFSNKEFKVALENCIKHHGQMLEAGLLNAVNKNVSEFQGEAKDIVERFQEHVQGFLDDASQMGTLDISINMNIDNGVNVAGLIGSVVGGVGLFFITGGWALAIAALGVLISVLKAFASFLSSDYKKSQQRKSADSKLEEVFDSVKTKYVSQLEASFVKLEEKMMDIKAGFNLSALQTEQIKLSLADSSRRLSLISGNIMKEGGL